MHPAMCRLSLRSPWLACLMLALCIVSTGAAGQAPPTNHTTSEVIYRDCSDIPPNSASGVYQLQPGLAYCDMEQNGGGWTVLIRRNDIEPREDFYQNWESYKWGFGHLQQEFYWGNEHVWMLTSQLDRRYKVHISLEDWDGNTRHALYQDFVIESEDDHYRLRVGEYSGDAGDSLSGHNNYSFTTFDNDNDVYRFNCAVNDKAGWWFVGCTRCQLTGEYYDGGYSGALEQGITWDDWKSSDPYSLKAAVMKIKPSHKA